jgi:predicted membrane metal-binding protein
MSVADPTPQELARTATETLPTPHTPVKLLVAGIVAVVQGLAFWVAALLPLAYVPLLATGIVAQHPVGFLGVTAVNAVAFAVGHAHDPAV